MGWASRHAPRTAMPCTDAARQDEVGAAPADYLQPVPVAGRPVGDPQPLPDLPAQGRAGLGLYRLRRAAGSSTAAEQPRPDRSTVPTSSGWTAMIRRTPQHYQQGFARGYLDNRPNGGYRNGLVDGLEELVDDNVIDHQTVRAILNAHPIAVQYLPGWDRAFNPQRSDRLHDEDGYETGRADGFDQGYEAALTLYGYTRKYSAIPSGNKQAAAQDNNGTCVYCNFAPIADIDHIHPLKVHWKDRGATQSQYARSAEANDLRNLVGTCANCNRSKGSKLLVFGWHPPAWGNQWWPYGPARVVAGNSPPPYW